MKVIGISGKKQSGKDTVAAMLSLMYPGCVKYYFAGELKKEVARACGVTTEYIDQHKPNFRLILQGWGTDFRRNVYGDDYWLKKMDIALESLHTFKYLLIPDVRFKNEYEWVKGHGGVMIRLERPSSAIDTHPSETELDSQKEWDYVLDNSGTPEQLLEQVKQIKL